jgi:DNA-binding SARP family transcriptional activator
MDFRLLGPLEVRDGDRLLPLGAAKQRALLAILLVTANEVVPAERLIDELWGERPPDSAATAVHVYVSRLRKQLPADVLVTCAPGYVLRVGAEELDVRRFETLVAAGRGLAAQDRPEGAAALLSEALALWRGPALAEFAFEAFAQREIARLEELRVTVLEERIEAELELGRHAELVGELEGLVADHPLRERLRRQLMLSLYRSGRQAEALDVYQSARRVLVAELGIEPGRGLQWLEQAILSHDPELEVPRRKATERPPTPERTSATVIFADLGTPAECEPDPEAERAFLERIYAAARDEIERAGGTVQEGLADALLATFSADRGVEHARRALVAALATRRRLSELFGDRLAVRLGVDSGEVLVGPRHGGGSFVAGAPVTGAARLVRAARPGEILVGAATAAAASGAFELRDHSAGRLLVRRLANAGDGLERA